MKKNIHSTWHKFCKYMEKWYYLIGKFENNEFKYFTSSKMVGYTAMCRIKKYLKNEKDIIITRCDNSRFMSSDIVLITHESDDDFMGTTMILVPSM